MRGDRAACWVAAFVAGMSAGCRLADIDLGESGAVKEPMAGESGNAEAHDEQRAVDVVDATPATGDAISAAEGATSTTEGADASGVPANAAASFGAETVMPSPEGPTNTVEAESADTLPDRGATAGGPQPSGGCGTQPPPSDTSIRVNGLTGTFILDLPADYDRARPYPLILAFRGAGETAETFRSDLDLVSVVGNQAILVNVNSLDDEESWGVRRDLPLFDALVDHFSEDYCIDERRIFATGHASGGDFVSTLGCLRGPTLRGIAPLSAGPPEGFCKGNTAVWTTYARADNMFWTGRAGRNFWAYRNGCNVDAPHPVSPTPCVEYAGCEPGLPVRYCEHDGRRGLPGFAAAGVWDFLRAL